MSNMMCSNSNFYYVPNGDNGVNRMINQQNPLKFLESNSYAGTLHIENIRHINKLYDQMLETIKFNEGYMNAYDIKETFRKFFLIISNKQDF